MDDSARKLKRVVPLIKVRKNQLNLEASALATIRHEKSVALQALKNLQDAYMQSVDELNKERMSAKRERLVPLERGVDFVKSQWHLAIKKLQLLENDERMQLLQLRIAERNLKSVEKLEERYALQVAHTERTKEQQANDEAALRKIIIKRA